MSRARKNTMQITCRINFDYIVRLKLINPSIVKRDGKGNLTFRHGALGKYLERLIAEDLEKREKMMQDEQLQNFMRREKEPFDEDSGEAWIEAKTGEKPK